MDVIVKGRHTGVPQRFRDHATEKLAKVAKLDPKVIRVDVEVSKERNPKLSDRRERVELTCRSRGPVIRAEACADDRYAALDLALAKLKERLRKVADRRKVHRGQHTPVSVAAATAPLGENDDARVGAGSRESIGGASGHTVTAVPEGEREDPSAGASVPVEMEGEGPLIVREKIHEAGPMTLDQALFQMELVGHDFFLFRDRDCGMPSVVYRRRGYDYGVLRLRE